MNLRAYIGLVITIALVVIFLLGYYGYYHWRGETKTFPSHVWQEYEERFLRNSSAAPFLPDFSYSGYTFQRDRLPDFSNHAGTGEIYAAGITWHTFSVIDYGATPDGESYCESAVMTTINHAKNITNSKTGAIIYFPPGIYKFGEKNDKKPSIKISTSNILLKGAGSDKSILLQDNYKTGNNNHLIYATGVSHQGKVEKAEGIFVTYPIERETNTLKVSSVNDFKKGDCFRLKAKSLKFVKGWFGSVPLDSRWTQVSHHNGILIDQPHCILEIDETKNILTLDAPLHFSLPVFPDAPITLHRINMLRNIGVQDLRFEGNWKLDDSEFCHLCDEKNKEGWQAVKYNMVRDSWIRDCIFDSWIQSITIHLSRGNTINNTQIVGKGGHHGFRSLFSYGNLFLGNRDDANTFHGPSVEGSDSGTVICDHIMSEGQAIDPHGGLPAHTLFDRVSNGVLFGAGGAETEYPNHADMLTIWNFKHRAKNFRGKTHAYRFWPREMPMPIRVASEYFRPILIGLHGDSFTIDETTVLKGEGLINAQPDPPSLFYAQLQLRKTNENKFPLYFMNSALIPESLRKKPSNFKVNVATDYNPKVVIHYSDVWHRYMYQIICGGIIVAITLIVICYKYAQRFYDMAREHFDRSPNGSDWIPLENQDSNDL